MYNYYLITTYIMFGIVGLMVGSFLNVVIYRLPRGMNLAKPSSHCPDCNHKLAWYDNVPLLSYIILGGKCRYCGKKITPRYFIVELLNAVLWVLLVLTFYNGDRTYLMNIFVVGVNALTVSVLITIALCDAENMFIPDSLQIAFLILAIANVFTDTSIWQEKLIGLFIGGGFFLMIYFLSFLLFKREGLGLGDVKLMAIAGLYLGFKNVLVAIIIAVFSALIFCALNKKTKTNESDLKKAQSESDVSSENDGTSDKKGAEFPFAPYLAFGILISLYLGTMLVQWYLSLFAL